MHKTIPEALSFVEGLKRAAAEFKGVEGGGLSSLYRPWPRWAEALRGTEIATGAQDVHWEEKGAFTGRYHPGCLRMPAAVT